MCLNAKEEFVSEEQFSLRYIIILLEYYKVVAKGLSNKGLDIYKEFYGLLTSFTKTLFDD